MIHGDNQQVTLGWLAGILDGEGSFIVRCTHVERKKRAILAQIKVSSTDATIAAGVVEALDMLDVSHYISEYAEKGNRKRVWDVIIGKQTHIKKLLDIITPYLTRLRGRGILMLRFCNSRLKRGKLAEYDTDEVTSAIRVVEANGNQRGTSETLREAFSHVLNDDKVRSHVRA